MTEGNGRAAEREPAESSSPIEYLTYAAGAIAASWGLMEILLSVDPFTMRFFKYGGWLGLVAAGVGVALAAAIGRGLWAAIFGGSAAIVLGAAALAPVAMGFGQDGLSRLDGAFMSMDAFLAADRAGWSSGHALILFGAVLLATASLASARRAWVRRNLTAPMVVALFAVACFATVLSIGRAREIDRRDIALEELRAAGMGYTLSGVQNALFFLNDRGLKLYRDAGFEVEDIFLALGRTSDFSQDAPLLFEMIDRVEGAIVGPGGDVDQALRFQRLIAEAYAMDAEGGVDAAFPLFEPGEDGRLSQRAGGPRALASYAAERGAETVLAVIADSGGALLYGADIGAVAPAPLTRSEGRGLRLDAFSAEQAHLYAVLDPLAALAMARIVSDAPLDATGDGPALCAVLRAQAAAGAAPHPFVADIAAQLECPPMAEMAGADARASAGGEVSRPPVLDGAARAGVLVRRSPGRGCTVGSARWAADADLARFVQTTDGGVWTAPVTGTAQIAAEEVGIAGALHIRGQDHRILYGPESLTVGLAGFDWTALDASGEPQLAVGEGRLMVYGVDVAALFADGRARAPVRLSRIVAEDDEEKAEDEGDGGEIVGSLTTDRGVVRTLLIEDVADLVVSTPRASVDLCVEAFRAGSDAPAASVFVARGEAAEMALPGVSVGEEVTLRVAAAEPTAGARVALRAALTAPTIQCAPRGEALDAPGSAWISGAAGAGRMPEDRAVELFCPIIADTPVSVTLTLEDLASDVDLELLFEPEAGAPLVSIDGSAAGGTAPERLERVLAPGRYYVRLYTFGEPGSTYRLAVERADVLAPIEDAYGPSDVDAPHALGTLAVDGAAIEIADAIDATTAETFEVSLSGSGVLTATVEGVTGDLSALMLDELGRTLMEASAADGALTMAALVEPGPVRVLLQSFGAVQSPYRMSLRLEGVNDVDFGVLPPLGLDSVQGRVAAGLPPDTARFALDEAAPVRIRLQGMSADADVFLLDASGAVLDSGRNGGAADESFSIDLAPGAYTLRVEAFGSAQTDYRLSVQRLE